MKKPLVITISVIVAVVIAICIGGAISQIIDSGPNAVPDAGVRPVVSLPYQGVSPKSTPDVIQPGDYAIGAKYAPDALQLTPGTYLVAGDGCYWARVKAFTGELDDIIANGNVAGNQKVRVTVKRSDGGLSLNALCAAARLK